MVRKAGVAYRRRIKVGVENQLMERPHSCRKRAVRMVDAHAATQERRRTLTESRTIPKVGLSVSRNNRS